MTPTPKRMHRILFRAKCAQFWSGDWLWWDTVVNSEAVDWRAYTIAGLRWVRRGNGHLPGDGASGIEVYVGPVSLSVFFLHAGGMP